MPKRDPPQESGEEDTKPFELANSDTPPSSDDEIIMNRNGGGAVGGGGDPPVGGGGIPPVGGGGIAPPGWRWSEPTSGQRRPWWRSSQWQQPCGQWQCCW